MSRILPTVTREADCVRIAGPVTMDTVAHLAESGGRLLASGAPRVSFAGATEVDSAAVAMLLQWLREARLAGRRVHVDDAPPALANLARLYDVADLLEIPDRR